jgi:hypothetical protein
MLTHLTKCYCSLSNLDNKVVKQKQIKFDFQNDVSGNLKHAIHYTRQEGQGDGIIYCDTAYIVLYNKHTFPNTRNLLFTTLLNLRAGEINFYHTDNRT